MEQELTLTEKLAPSMLKAAKSYLKALEPVTAVLKEFRKATVSLKNLDSYERPDVQPSIRYALAGYPYHKTTKGKKRWILEMKRKHR